MSQIMNSHLVFNMSPQPKTRLSSFNSLATGKQRETEAYKESHPPQFTEVACGKSDSLSFFTSE